MSLLLDALKKAEARQSDPAQGVGVETRDDRMDAEKLRAETRLELEALSPSRTSASAPVRPSSAAASRQAMLAKRSSLANGSKNVSNSLSGSVAAALTSLGDRLSFPVVVALVLMIGGVSGGFVLYRSYTAMPSAIGTESASADSVQPGDSLLLKPLPAAPVASSAAVRPSVSSAPLTQAPVAAVVPVAETPLRTRMAAPLAVTPDAVLESPPDAPTPEALPAPAQKTPRTPRSSERGVGGNARGGNAASFEFNRGQQTHDELAASLQSAYQALQSGDRVTALAQYQRALQLDRNNLDAVLGLGYLAQQNGLPEQAEGHFKRALAIDPRDPYALSALAGLSAATGNAAGYEGPYENRLKSFTPSSGDKNGDRAAMQFALGNMMAAQQRWSEAQQAYFDAVAAAPRNPDYLFNLAVSLDQLHQSKPALDYYRKALGAANGAATPAHFNREQVQLRVQALEQALSAPAAQP